jgi:glycerophosphoryl diester phosphodiesterase
MEPDAVLPGPDFLVLAHRGASAERPENTLPAFELAVELGADGVELDVQLCDGELVVIHDDTLERTTDGRGTVAGTPLADLRALDAGGGARVPLLAEVLEVVAAPLLVNVELKGPDTAAPVIALLETLAIAPARILLSSFEHGQLEVARARAPAWPRGALFGRLERTDPEVAARALGAATANLARRTVTAERVNALRAAGLEVLVYTVNEPEEALALRGLGVRGVFTDRPRALLEAIGRR